MKLFIFLILFPLVSFARWATPSDYDFALSKFETVYDIKKDGTYEVSFNKEFEILTEAGVKAFSSYQETFNPQTTKLKFHEAWVEDKAQGRVPVLSNAMSEITPPSSTVFDPITTWQVKLSDLKVGSKFGVRYSLIVSKPMVDGHFSYFHYFGLNGVWIKEGSVIFRSELPLEVVVEDQGKYLKLERFKKKQDEIKLSLSKPISLKTVEETGVLPESHKIAAFVSTSKNWDLIRRQIQSRFDLIFNAPLIPELDNIIEMVKKKRELEDSVSYLLSLLNAQLKHTDDWQTIKGTLAVRPLKDIFKSKYADDKEFAAIVTIVLKKLGYPAEIALVEKSSALLSSNKSMPLPVLPQLNHAIVRIETQADTYWIDPSLAINFGMNLTVEVLGKQALVLNNNSEVARIPDRNTSPAIMTITNSFFQDKSVTKSEGSLSLTGIFAYNVFQRYLQNPLKADLENRVTFFISGKLGVDHSNFKPYTLNPHEFSNLEFKTVLSGVDLTKTDEKGVSTLVLPEPPFPYITYTQNNPNRVTDLYLGEPQEFRMTTILQKMIPADRSILRTCEVQSRWYNYVRKANILSKVFTINEVFESKLNVIPVSDLNSEEFKVKGQALLKCVERKSIEFLTPVTR